MRKLRRLPWRIPKSHNAQPAAAQPEVAAHVDESPRESIREALNTQPVAFAGGRYVYGARPASTTCTTEIRRKARHRIIGAPALNPQQA